MKEPTLLDAIEEIGRDNRHGATYLTRLAALAFLRALRKGTDPDTLRRRAVFLAETRPMMASIFNFSNGLLVSLEEGRDAAEEYCETFPDRLKRDAEATAERGALWLAGARRIVTHSYSSLVCDALLRRQRLPEPPEVVCTESRPAREGVELARRLCREGMKVTLVTDAAVGLAMGEADAVILGADGIGPFGLVHKTGTYPLLLMAAQKGVPAVSLAPTSRFWPSRISEPSEPPKPAKEVAEEEGCFEVNNRYFDVSPLDLLESVMTERGEVDADGALRTCEKISLHPLLADYRSMA